VLRREMDMKQHGNVHSKAGRKNGKLGGRPIGRKDTKPRKKKVHTQGNI
jgi:hypothetical protein